MAIRTELSLKLANTPGALGRVCQALSDERVNILALELEAHGVLRLVVDNHVHALGLLRDQRYPVESRDVLYVSMPNEAGALARVLRPLAEAGINLDYAYVSSMEGHPMAAVVIGVPDAQRASTTAGL